MPVTSPAVIFIARPGVTAPTLVTGAVQEHEWELETVEAVPITAGSGRRLLLLSRIDANDLYVRLHRSVVAVVHEAGIQVRRDPSEGARDDKLDSLPRFCKHKAFVRCLTSEDVTKWAEDFITWAGLAGCDGKSDPRCLPFHMFQYSQLDQVDLSMPDAREAFVRKHRKLVGSNRGWLDQNRLLWSAALPGTLHGREPMTVAGHRLEAGFHWDVIGTKRKLTSAATKWRVTTYTNVYPDGLVRRSSGSSQIWSEEDSRAADTSDRESAGMQPR